MKTKSKRLEAELKVEHEAAKDFFERTKKNFYGLSKTEQRKIIENWKEDHAAA